MMYVNSRGIIERMNNGQKEIVIQKRNKENEQISVFELPGGRIEEFESITDALIREVKEETGLKITSIVNVNRKIITTNHGSEVECLQPAFSFQTIDGPIDSLGYYFICEAEGELLIEGDGTKDIQWINKSYLEMKINNGTLDFNGMDYAALKYYFELN